MTRKIAMKEFQVSKLKPSKRAVAPEMFSFLNGKWDDRTIAKSRHRIYGVVTMDIYPWCVKGPLEDEIIIPDNVCDRRFVNQPEYLRFRHKEQFVEQKRLWCYHETPAKLRKLHPYLLGITNDLIKKIEDHFDFGTNSIPRYDKTRKFNIFSFLTIAPSQHRCLWRVSKTVDENNEEIIVPMLAKIDDIDTALMTWNDVVNIAGGMCNSECKMTSRQINQQICLVLANR